MTEALASGVAIAASPFAIIPAILLLFTTPPLANGLGFLAGWTAGIAGSATIFTLLADSVDSNETAPTWASWSRIVLGILLLVYGVRSWLTRDREAEPPRWTSSIETSTPTTALRLGVLLSAANPKVLLLSAAAGLTIGGEELTKAEVVFAVALVTVVAATSVALPPLLYAIAGERVLTPMGRGRDWLLDNSSIVMAVVMAVIGVALLAKGFSALTHGH